MADYYPLLARALDALPDRSPALRKAVYERARGALIGQLRSLEPPLSEGDIDRERGALEAAIDRLEIDHGGAPLPPEPFRAAGDPIPEASPPAGVRDGAPPAGAVPILPPASYPNLGSTEPGRDGATVPPDPIAAPRPDAMPVAARIVPPPAGNDAEPASGVPAAESLHAAPTGDAQNGRRRPRIDVVSPRRSNARLLRNAFVGSVLALVIGLIATAAYLLRDRPGDLQTVAGEGRPSPVDGADTKYSDRVGGEGPAAERVASGPAVSTGAASLPAQPGLAVAQRAVLIEENQENQNAPPAMTQGRVLWRLDAVNGEQGQPLETAVHATIDFPDAGLTLAMTIRRNLDETLPASHTIELAFTNSATAGAKRTVQDVGLIQAKDDENMRGSPVSGLPVKVRENLFLIGLSSLRNDVDRNTDLMLHKNWFDLAIRFSGGPRAVVTFEKGSSGIQVMQDAFTQWRS